MILAQYKRYPLSQVSDILKLLYQSEFGCGHMVTDPADSLCLIREETDRLPEPALDGAVFETIGSGYCRLYLRALRRDLLTSETLCAFLVYTAGQPAGEAAGFEQKAAAFIALCEDKSLPFDAGEVYNAIDKLRADGYPPFRHSAQYRAAYSPAYRVVRRELCDFLPLFGAIDALIRKGKPVTVAVDGGSGAGKSTLAALLKSIYGCNVFSMDHFFLRPEQRTSKRLGEVGGNIDYERFSGEVLTPLKAGETFFYRPYDCRTGALSEPIAVNPHPLNVVEGVYSQHPHFGDYCDLKVFLAISKPEQRRRLLARNPQLYDRFVGEWVPKEDGYFDHFGIADRCDLIFNTGEQEGCCESCSD